MIAIEGKTAHWGRHSFKAMKYIMENGKRVTRIDVYRHCPNKYETSFFFNTINQLINLSIEETCALQFYTGSLTGKTFVIAVESGLKIDEFINCFRHKN